MKQKKHLPGWVVVVVVAAVLLVVAVIYYKGTTPTKMTAEDAIRGLREAAKFDRGEAMAAEIHKAGGVMPCTYYTRKKLKVPPNCQLHSIWAPPSASKKVAEVIKGYSSANSQQ